MLVDDQIAAEKLELQALDAEPPFYVSFVDKVKKQPFLIGSIFAFTSIAAVGAWRWKTRKTKDPALYLVQLRVAAQGTAVGLLGLGMIYQMLNDFVFNDKKALAEKKV